MVVNEVFETRDIMRSTNTNSWKGVPEITCRIQLDSRENTIGC
jgi:hypothetical protein